jgi:hypothetical protein
MRLWRRFLRAGDRLIAVDAVTSVDTSRIEALEVSVRHRDGVDVAVGQDAIDVVMALRPSALEGKRLRFARHAWALHNLVGHPLLQVLVWLGARRLGMAVHDATVPRPRGG